MKREPEVHDDVWRASLGANQADEPGSERVRCVTCTGTGTGTHYVLDSIAGAGFALLAWLATRPRSFTERSD